MCTSHINKCTYILVDVIVEYYVEIMFVPADNITIPYFSTIYRKVFMEIL